MVSLDRERIIGNLLTIFIAGSDSSASTLCAAIVALARDTTGIQEQIANEIDTNLPWASSAADAASFIENISLHDVLPSSSSSKPTFKLPILKSFLLEVTRYFPAFPLLFLQTKEDNIPFANTCLPKGQKIIVASRYIMKHGCQASSETQGVPVGPNGELPSEFCPRRFLVKANNQSSGGSSSSSSSSNGHTSQERQQVYDVRLPEKNSMSYLTFGHGARICPGQSLSETIITVTIASLLQRYTIQLAPNHPPITHVLGFAEMPEQDVRIVLIPRHTPKES